MFEAFEQFAGQAYSPFGVVSDGAVGDGDRVHAFSLRWKMKNYNIGDHPKAISRLGVRSEAISAT